MDADDGELDDEGQHWLPEGSKKTCRIYTRWPMAASLAALRTSFSSGFSARTCSRETLNPLTSQYFLPFR